MENIKIIFKKIFSRIDDYNNNLCSNLNINNNDSNNNSNNDSNNYSNDDGNNDSYNECNKNTYDKKLKIKSINSENILKNGDSSKYGSCLEKRDLKFLQLLNDKTTFTNFLPVRKSYNYNFHKHNLSKIRKVKSIYKYNIIPLSPIIPLDLLSLSEPLIKNTDISPRILKKYFFL